MKSAIEAAKHDVVAIGIGAPGNIDPAGGTIRYSPNFGWTNVPLGDHVRAAEIDADCGARRHCGTRGDGAGTAAGAGVGGATPAGASTALDGSFHLS